MKSSSNLSQHGDAIEVDDDDVLSSSFDECALFSILSTIISISMKQYKSDKVQTNLLLSEIKEKESIITKLEIQESIRCFKNKLARQNEFISDLTEFLDELLDDDDTTVRSNHILPGSRQKKAILNG